LSFIYNIIYSRKQGNTTFMQTA